MVGYTFVLMLNRIANIVECPRDAMQGIQEFIGTDVKIAYLNHLLQCGFDTLDFGSFVSPKAIPQMSDTKQVLESLDLSQTETKLLAIVANRRGIEDAASFETISYLGFPFSISETFQRRNTHSGIEEAFQTVKYLAEVCHASGKTPVVYLSMGFGNPYGDPWNTDIVLEWSHQLVLAGIPIISLADTLGMARPKEISSLFQTLIPSNPAVTFGAHFHTRPDTWQEKIAAAWHAGCNRFDGAIKGYGGCPMATDALTGNMPTERLLDFLEAEGAVTGICRDAFNEALVMASGVFPNTH